MAAKLRGATTLIALLVLAALVGGVAVWNLMRRPDPATASTSAIFRWLATDDISDEPEDVQLALVDRLERELKVGIPPSRLSEAGDVHRRTLAANAALLKRLWFVRRVDQYHALPTGEREVFLDERLETVLAWSSLDAALADASTRGGGAQQAAGFFDDIGRWIDEAPTDELRGQMKKIVYDGVVQWLATRTLDAQPLEVRIELARRIADQLDDGLSAASVAGQRLADEQATLRHNSALLMEGWLVYQAREYADLPRESRSAYLDRQIQRVHDWGVLELLAEGASGGAANPVAALAAFSKRAQASVDSAPPEDKPKVQQLVDDVQARMVQRWLQDAMGR